MKSFISVLLLLFVGLQYKLWFDDGNIYQIMKLRENYKAQHALYKDMLKVNKKLSNQVVAYKQEGDVLEEKARSELGLVKEDEVYYQIIERPVA